MDFKGSKTSSIGSKNQTKNLKRRRRLSRLYSNNNSLKIAHVWNAVRKVILLETVKVVSRATQQRVLIWLKTIIT